MDDAHKLRAFDVMLKSPQTAHTAKLVDTILSNPTKTHQQLAVIAGTHRPTITTLINKYKLR